MKNFDLNAYSVSEMSEAQTRDVNGGLILEVIIIIATYKIGRLIVDESIIMSI
jgi:hypothetical protein